jgi:hypothetical protein
MQQLKGCLGGIDDRLSTVGMLHQPSEYIHVCISWCPCMYQLVPMYIYQLVPTYVSVGAHVHCRLNYMPMQ